MSETLKFILMCAGVLAGLTLLAWLFERFCCRQRHSLKAPRYIATVAVFGALAGLLMLLEIPLVFIAPDFYKLDFSEIPVLICSFYLGPVAGILTQLLKIAVKLLIKGTTSAFVGEFANFVIGCAFVLPASMIYHLRKSKKTALLGLLAGTLVMTVFGTLFNAWYLLPAFAELFGCPMDTILAMGQAINPRITNVATFVAFAVAPVNLIKGGLDSALTFLLYKRVEKVLFRSAR